MKTISEKQLAANRTNAISSTGPRTPEGKARAAGNSCKHGLAAATYTATEVEETAELEDLVADAVAFYQPQNSQEQFAVERIALCQLAILRAYRLEAGALTSCFAEMMDGSSDHVDFGSSPLPQRINHGLAQGLQRQTSRNSAWCLVLRYQAQADRQYRRAVEDFERLKRERMDDSPNEPISAPEPQETKPEAAVTEECVPAPPMPGASRFSGLLRVSSAPRLGSPSCDPPLPNHS